VKEGMYFGLFLVNNRSAVGNDWGAVTKAIHSLENIIGL